MEPVETFTHCGMEVKIYQDTDAEPPENDETDLFIVTTKNRYFQLNPRGLTMEACNEKDFQKDYHVIILNAYIHSGVALSLGTEYPFNCPWDAGQIGYVCVGKRKGFRNIRKAALTYVETWNQYLSGEVYGVEVGTEEEDCNSWGFYGIEFTREEGKRMAEYAAGKKAKADTMESECYAL